jgi:hypothetical protein
MKREFVDRMNSFSFILVLCALMIFSWFIFDVDFPVFEYSGIQDRQLLPVDPFNDIAGGASRFLWESRSLDIAGQSFVIVAAVICCLAMLKRGDAP